MSVSSEPPARARASCFHCRNSKRRCDKTLPKCHLCSRKSIECRYPRRRGQRSASPDGSPNNRDDTAATATSSTTTLRQDNGPEFSAELVTTTAIRFLAPDLFRDLRLQVPRMDWDIPEEVAFHLGDRQQMQQTTSEFLRLTQSWMPVVSGKRHLAAVLNPLQLPLRRPTALLALCMKLCCLPADNSQGRRSLYLLVKRLYVEAERMEDACLEVMQSAIFIAIFEIGDAMFSAAYLTVGALARYGMAMGMDKINRDALGSKVGVTVGASWSDIEEMRRVWWATLVLDRFLNFSQPSRSLVTADPSFEDFLPVDDECFHNQKSTPENATRISEGFHFEMGSFARLCQGTHLVSKALALCRVTPGSNGEASISDDMVQLCRTLEALVRVNEIEATTRKLAYCSQSIISYIGILVLQQHHWQHGNPAMGDHIFPETESALDTLERISTTLRQGGSYSCNSIEGGHCSLFFVELVYRGMLVLITMSQRRPTPEVQSKKESMKWLLSHIQKRWPLVAVYGRILEAREMMLAVEAASI
ncbi:hypothetical protein F53441_5340 [Fusarium austroafricanum]|uniref:Zn(2)-C6 fungal-type domain-containing protein n=1 Tax=Fusarium austroafricanum TaxID=2364996 RepID=A0A8H4KKW2_9HYPO|nr:hypothetical protein F53441_5340 [Fusarium austroafricanum]